jgi:integrase
MAAIVITDALLRSLKVETRTDFWDARTPGFGVRASARRKVFIAKVHNRRYTIGTYPDISLAEARRKALGIKARAREVPACEVTFQSAYEIFKVAHIAQKTERTQHDYTRVLDKYYLPTLGKLPLSRITSAQIAKITDPLLDTPSEYGHVLAVARMFLRWCVRPPRQYITHSPLEGIQLPRYVPRDRVLSDEELVQVWRAAEEIDGHFASIVKLCILLGQRRSQTAAIERSWIDQENMTISFPRDAVKNRKPHLVRFGDLAAAILKEETPEIGDLLFPARGCADRSLNGWSKCTKELREKLSDVPHFVLHDLRRTFASGLQRLGVRLEVTEALLGHVSGSLGGIRGVYQRYDYAKEKREAILLWEVHVLALLNKNGSVQLARVA